MKLKRKRKRAGREKEKGQEGMGKTDGEKNSDTLD
jgi:hypothetical protein